MVQDCLWSFVCCDQLQQRSGVENKPESHVLGLRATGMMYCSLASNSSLDHDQFNEIRWKLRRRFAPPNSVVDCSW